MSVYFIPAGTGTVTSVALSLPSELSVSGSPVTASGTLSASWANQTTNKVFAAPNGSTGAPSFRTLVAADVPTLPTSKISTFAVVSLTDQATLTIDASTGNEFRVTLGGNRTFAAPTNPTDGQKIVVRIKQDATGSRTVTWDAAFRFPGGTEPTLTSTANKATYLGFIYNSTDGVWDLVAQKLNI